MGWAFRERAAGSQVQQQAEAIKFALVKAAEQGWRIIKVDVANKQLLEQIQGKKNMDKWTATLLQDIRELSTLFYKCSFCLNEVNKNALTYYFSAHALTNYYDVEWASPKLLC